MSSLSTTFKVHYDQKLGDPSGHLGGRTMASGVIDARAREPPRSLPGRGFRVVCAGSETHSVLFHLFAVNRQGAIIAHSSALSLSQNYMLSYKSREVLVDGVKEGNINYTQCTKSNGSDDYVALP